MHLGSSPVHATIISLSSHRSLARIWKRSAILYSLTNGLRMDVHCFLVSIAVEV